MHQFLGPISGFAVGVLLIVFRGKIAIVIQRVVEAFFKLFPMNEYRPFKLSVRPSFIAILGVMYIFVAIYCTVEIAKG